MVTQIHPALDPGGRKLGFPGIEQWWGGGEAAPLPSMLHPGLWEYTLLYSLFRIEEFRNWLTQTDIRSIYLKMDKDNNE